MLDTGEPFLLESEEGQKWLDTIIVDPETGKEKGLSFRYEPTGDFPAFTARNQPIKGVSYWYGSRKVAGDVRKQYIGKLDNMTIYYLEKVAEELQNREPKAVDKKIQSVEEQEPKAVAENSSNNRLDTFESRLQKVEEQLGKVSGLGVSNPETLKPDTVVETELSKKLDTLEAELETAKNERDQARADYAQAQTKIASAQQEIATTKQQLEEAKIKLAEREETSISTQQPPTEFEFPEPAEVLNQLKAKRKKSKAELADVRETLEILEAMMSQNKC
jgi:DNA repair exonuclease SbcCD ATPase subunit